MAGRHVRNQSITSVDDRIGDGGCNEVNVFSSHDNTAVNQDVETVRTLVMSGTEDKNSDRCQCWYVSQAAAKPTDQCYCYVKDRHCNNVKDNQF